MKSTQSDSIEVFANALFKQRELSQTVSLSDSDLGAKVPDGFRRVTLSPKSLQRWHPRIIPTRYVSAFDEVKQFSFAGQSMRQAQPGEFNLLRMENLQCIEAPIVERTMVFKFESADGVGDVLD